MPVIPQTPPEPTDYHRFFSRQARIQSIGKAGLERLRGSKVAIVGVGALGSVAADLLARSGIGHLRLIDQDIVDPTNIHRMFGVTASDVYLPKSEVVADHLSSSYRWMTVEPVVETLRESNSSELLGQVDIVIDGLDNFRTRYLVNRHSVLTETPYVFASAVARQGHVALFTPPKSACLECRFPRVETDRDESCETLGVTATTTGLIGTITADLAMETLLGHESRLKGRILTIDLDEPVFLITDLPRSADCRTCSDRKLQTEPPDSTHSLWMMCGARAATILPERTNRVDLDEVRRQLPPESILASSPRVLVFRESSATVSLFKTGRMIVQGVHTVEAAIEIARTVGMKLVNLEASVLTG